MVDWFFILERRGYILEPILILAGCFNLLEGRYSLAGRDYAVEAVLLLAACLRGSIILMTASISFGESCFFSWAYLQARVGHLEVCVLTGLSILL